MEGIIAHSIQGDNGFGYDPIVYLPEFQKTSAQLSAEEKNKISHRGKALELLKEKLKKYLVNNDCTA
jgi:XTP/dITP diphosphohydrolase